MSFSESFAQILAQSGIEVDSNVIPDRQEVLSDLDSLQAWLSSLEEDTQAAIDDVTAANPIRAQLADAGIVQSIKPILAAFDDQSSSISISAALGIMKGAADQASE
jgi:polysaccharide deacetylase 2 family uncharacterized protein YibQ